MVKRGALRNKLLIGAAILAALGIGYFIYGKRQKKPISMACGIGLLGYTYTVTDPIIIVTIGLVLMAIPVFMRHR